MYLWAALLLIKVGKESLVNAFREVPWYLVGGVGLWLGLHVLAHWMY